MSLSQGNKTVAMKLSKKGVVYKYSFVLENKAARIFDLTDENINSMLNQANTAGIADFNTFSPYFTFYPNRTHAAFSNEFNQTAKLFTNEYNELIKSIITHPAEALSKDTQIRINNKLIAGIIKHAPQDFKQDSQFIDYLQNRATIFENISVRFSYYNGFARVFVDINKDQQRKVIVRMISSELWQSRVAASVCAAKLPKEWLN